MKKLVLVATLATSLLFALVGLAPRASASPANPTYALSGALDRPGRYAAGRRDRRGEDLRARRERAARRRLDLDERHGHYSLGLVRGTYSLAFRSLDPALAVHQQYVGIMQDTTLDVVLQPAGRIAGSVAAPVACRRRSPSDSCRGRRQPRPCRSRWPFRRPRPRTRAPRSSLARTTSASTHRPAPAWRHRSSTRRSNPTGRRPSRSHRARPPRASTPASPGASRSTACSAWRVAGRSPGPRCRCSVTCCGSARPSPRTPTARTRSATCRQAPSRSASPRTPHRSPRGRSRCRAAPRTVSMRSSRHPCFAAGRSGPTGTRSPARSGWAPRREAAARRMARPRRASTRCSWRRARTRSASAAEPRRSGTTAPPRPMPR